MRKVRTLLQAVSVAALAATLLPSVCFLAGRCELTQVKTVMLVGTIVWFIVTPLWMGRQAAMAHEKGAGTP